MADAPEIWKPKFNPWLIAVVVALAAFMEVLDTSIANVALPHLAGDLGASNDESTWVLTSYLVSNAIVLPISGWLANLFGRKRFFLLCIFLFTVSSLLCGIAPSLPLLILFRVIQGVGGGGLQPMAQAILADTFPPQKRGLAFALYGITAIMAPTIGPTLGGWLTDNYSWRWIFYINLPVGIADLVSGAPDGGRSAVYRAQQKRRRARRLHRHRSARAGRGRAADSARQRPGRRLVRFALHRHAGGNLRRSRLVSLVFLGVAHQDTRHRRAHVQELQLRGGEPDDVFPGHASVRQPGDDAAVSADAHGIHGAVGRTGSFRRQPDHPGRDAHRRPAHHQNSREIYHGVRLAVSRVRYVLFHQGVGFGDQLRSRQPAPHGAGVRSGLPVRAHQSERLRRSPGRERQQRLGPGEFHAQHRKQRGNFHGHHDPGAARAISPIGAGFACHQIRSCLPESAWRTQPTTPACGSQRTRCAGGRPMDASTGRCRCSRKRWRISIPSWCWRSPPGSCFCWRSSCGRTIRAGADMSWRNRETTL